MITNNNRMLFCMKDRIPVLSQHSILVFSVHKSRFITLEM